MTECPDCGARNSARSAFCIRCGRPLSVAAPAADEPPTETPVESEAGRLVDDASELYAAGRLDDAVSACHAALDIDPDLVAARSLLGMVEEERGNLAQALAEYEAVTRLAPARTAERERAERLRAKVVRAAAPTLADDDTQRQRRMLISAAAALGVIILVLSIAVFWPRGNRPASPADAASAGMMGAVPGAGEMPPSGQTAPPSAANQEAAPGGFVFGQVGDNPLPATPIGAKALDDQTAAQPNGRNGHRSSSANNGVQSPSAKTWMPPPTIRDEGDQPLTLPGSEIKPPVLPSPAHPPQTVTRQATAPQQGGASQAPAMRRPKSEIRIEVAGDYPQTPAPSANGSRSQGGGQQLAPSATPPSGIPRVGSTGRRSTGALPRTSGNGGSAAGGQAAAPARRSVPVAPDRSRSQPTARPGGSSSAGAAQPQPIRAQGYQGRAAPMRASGAHRARQGTQMASAGQHSGSADQLRQRAQAEWQKGNGGQAKKMFQEAIRGYQQEGRQNPERAAASRSAVQSCQRAIDAVDAGQ